jgi:hypothetical protein
MHDQLMLPAGTLVLYEKIFLDAGNYKGNFKFCFTDQGAFYYQKNKNFYAHVDGHYDEDFPAEPKFQLSEELSQRLSEIIESFDIQGLDREYGMESMEMERWTFFKDEHPTMETVIWGSNRPESLRQLKDQLDQLLTTQKQNQK